jgi:hypothetical protein
MEITCTRCHQTVLDGNCFCPNCGLPQLTYAADGSTGPAPSEPWSEVVRDAGSINWRAAIRVALLLGVPVGMLCSLLSPVGVFGLIWMAITAAWVVMLYMRSQQSVWITIGAGARIGLVTGVLGGWTAIATTGISLFAMRFIFHQGSFFDDFWQNLASQQLPQQWAAMGVDAPTILQTQKMLLSPEGRAGAMLSTVMVLAAILVLCAVCGGAFGARMQSRRRRPGL